MTSEGEVSDVYPPTLKSSYRPVRELGRGAMGVVYLAEDLRRGGSVAVKIMTSVQTEDMIHRILREVKFLSRLDHPGLLKLIAAGKTPSGPYIVTEFLEGRSLEDVKPGEVEVASVMKQAAVALGEVHKLGLLHRDLKPANLFLTTTGRAVLLDFGLALDPDLTRLTGTAQLLGTPAYLAPELWRGGESSAASDWYAWGLTAFFLLEGVLPMMPLQVLEWAAGREEWRGPVFQHSDPNSALARAICATLEMDPEDRVRSAAELVSLLEQAPPGPETTGPRRAELVASESGLPEAMSNTPPAPTASMARPLALGLGLLGLTLGGAAWVTGWGAPPPPPPLPAIPPAPRDTPVLPVEPRTPAAPDQAFPKDYAARLLRELNDARELARTGTGRRVPWKVAAAEDLPLLNPDPASYWGTLRELPELMRFFDWVALGGDADQLPDALISQLEELDKEYLAAMRMRPFWPYLRLRPLTTRVGIPAPLWVSFKRWKMDRKSHSVTGWTGAAIQSLMRTFEIEERLQRELDKNPRGPIDGGEMMSLGGVLSGGVKLTTYLSGLSTSRTRRIAAHEWAREGAESLHRTLILCRRALEADEPNRELRGVVLAEAVADSGTFFIGAFASLPAAVRDGGPATQGATLFCRMEASRKAALRLRLADAVGLEAWDAVIAEGFEALEYGGEGDWARWRQARLFDRLCDLAGRASDRDALKQVVHKVLPHMEEFPSGPRGGGLARIATALVRDGDDLGMTRPQIQGLVRLMRSGHQRKLFGERLAVLEARYLEE